MNYPLALGLMVVFAIVGYFMRIATKQDKSLVVRSIPYVIWTCAVLGTVSIIAQYLGL